jgi:hypothetical protein
MGIGTTKNRQKIFVGRRAQGIPRAILWAMRWGRSHLAIGCAQYVFRYFGIVAFDCMMFAVVIHT